MSVKAVLATLPYKIKEQTEQKIHRNYVARCLRLITENTSTLSQGGKFISIEYEDIINPKPAEKRSSEDIINGIKDKIDKMNSLKSG